MLFAIVLTGCQPQPGAEPQREEQPSVRPAPEVRILPPDPAAVWPPRAVWVVRQAFKSPEEIAALMERCAQAGMNTVLFQVRGNATSYYRSRLEPWSEQYDFKDPGFDPLEVACREAHRRGMALHAWVNVMPAWRGSQPPANARHLYHAKPDWFLYDQRGRRQPLGDFYVSLNPCLPEARAHIVNVIADITARYPIDGVHLDYIRLPMESVPRGVDYPFDAPTLRHYRAATGKAPADDSAAWTRWRQEQVTRLVADIRRSVKAIKPAVRLSAACMHDFNEASSRFFQDGPAWLRANLLEALFVMNYTPDTTLYRQRQEQWLRIAPGTRTAVVPGIGVYMHNSPNVTIAQLQLAEQWGNGFALFSYGAMLEPGAGAGLDALQPTLASLAQRAATARRSAEARRTEPARPRRPIDLIP